MFVYTVPSYSSKLDNYYPSTAPTLYPLSYAVTPRPPTARERYLRAMADAQSARQSYLRELEERQLLESLRQQEALREAELRHHEALRQAALRQRQAQNFIARRRAGRVIVGGYGQPSLLAPVIRSQAPVTPQRVHPAVVHHQEQLRAVEELFSALMGVGAEDATEENPREQQMFEEARAEQVRNVAQDARDRFFTKLRTVREEAQTVRDLRAMEKPSTSSPHTRHDLDKTSTAPPSVVPLSRRPEIPRAQDRAARAIQRQWRSHSADAAARKDALHTIDVLRARLRFLRDSFTFPEHLEFRPQDSEQKTDAEVPALSYSPLNASVHAFMNELTKLLIQADGVPSGGSKRVRGERRVFVQDVEEQLKIVEARVAKIWGKRAEVSVKSQEIQTTKPAEVVEDVEAHVAVKETQTTKSAEVVEDVEAHAALEPIVRSILSESDPLSVALDDSVCSEVPLATSQATVIVEHQPVADENDLYSGDEPNSAARGRGIPVSDLKDGIAHMEAPLAVEDSRIEFAEGEESAVTVVGENTRAGYNAIDISLEPLPLSSSIAPQEDASEPSESSLSTLAVDSTDSGKSIDVHIPVRSEPASTQAVPEPFDIVYPDSRTATPTSFDGDAGHSDRDLHADDTESPGSKTHLRREDEEFEIL